MADDDELVPDLLRRIADGEEIDWDTLRTDRLSAELRALRAIDDVAKIHRAVPGAGDPGLAALSRMRWGRYLLTDPLGEGSFGEVFKAWDTVLRRDAAVKLLRPGVEAGDAVVGKVVEEGQRLARVKHANVVTVHAVEQHDGRTGLCMELVHGLTLEEIVRRDGVLKPLEAARIGVSVCGALGAVHDAGLVHRDVNARNVMREHAGRVVLMDFGSGMPSPGHDDCQRPAEGTPLFMAPELLTGVTATAATDLYSVGVLLYYLVSGTHPVEGRTVQEVVGGHQRRRARPLRERRTGLPLDFVRVVEKAISPDASQRYATAQDLRRVLNGVVARLERRAQWSHIAVSVMTVIGVTFAALLILGFITNQHYQYLLGIAGPFARATWTDHLRIGAQSLVAPVAGAGLVTGAVYLLLELFALLTRMSATLRKGVLAFRTRVMRTRVVQQLDVRDWARLAVFGSTSFLLWVPFVGFPTFTGAFWTTPLAEAPPDVLRLLGKPGMADQNAYRQAFAMALPFMCAAWMIIRRVARSSGVPLGATGWLGLGCVAAAVIMMDIPYRYLYQSVARRVHFEGHACYATVEIETASLLFCPTRSPRVLSVPHDHTSLVPTEEFPRISEDMELR